MALHLSVSLSLSVVSLSDPPLACRSVYKSILLYTLVCPSTCVFIYLSFSLHISVHRFILLMHINLSVHPSLPLHICRSLFTCPSTCPSACLSPCPSLSFHLSPSVYLRPCPSLRLPVPVCLCPRLSEHLSTRLLVRLFIYTV